MRSFSRRFPGLLVLLAILSGCDRSSPRFEANGLMTQRMAIENEMSMDPVRDDVQTLLEELFGTPDVPKWPSSLGSSEFAELNRPEWLDRAAGPVGRANDKIERGLYRKHCAHCHALNGDGAGPTAYFQNPYPRDFRRGSFKFKSTPIGQKPTFEDLRNTLKRGLAGTAMPAFESLTSSKAVPSTGDNDASPGEDELDYLVHYVRFLSIRGEVERRLLMKASSQFDLEKGERLYDPKLKGLDATAYAKRMEWVDSNIQDVARSWVVAKEKVLSVHEVKELRFELPDDLKSSRVASFKASVERGREVFQGATAACSLCHGKEGEGNGSAPDFDEWTKDWTIRAGIDPKDKRAWKVMKPFGALAPHRDPPRNFKHGVFRGGSSPEDIYRRIVGGIEGTPMPSVPIATDHPQGLPIEQVWDLVNFVRSLQYSEVEALSSSSSLDDSKGAK